MKFSDNDFAVMNLIWTAGEIPAIEIAEQLAKEKGWKKPTVYTLLDRLIKKGAIKRTAPDYICTALVKKEDVRTDETEGLLSRLYNGSAKLLVSGFIKDKRLSEDELKELRELIDKMSDN